MIYRWFGPYEDAWAKFDLSPIPDSGHIRAVSLHWYQHEVFSSDIRVVVTRVDCDPVVTSAETLFNATRYGSSLSGSESCNGIGWKERELNELGRQHVASCLSQNWVALGISELNLMDGGIGYGTDGGALAPYLLIDYSIPGTCEPRATPTRRPEVTIVPNPATGRFVMVRCTFPAGTYVKLTLRDVLGRAVRTFALDPSGGTHLDLRSLRPGVYIATLEAGTQSLTRKLVITAR
jgi:hypothetical protein